MHSFRPLVAALALAAAALLPPLVHGESATVEVDAREAPRGIEKVHQTLPVRPGKLTLIYPKWLPGEHAPNGPVGALSELRFLVDGRPLAWVRDPIDMFAFHMTIPGGASHLDIAFEVDAVAAADPPEASRTSTESLAVILWNQLLMYPAGLRSDEMQIAAKLLLPTGWSLGTALPQRGAIDDAVQFAPVSLTTLIDSTVIAGRYFRTVDLGGNPQAQLHLVADSAAALDMTPATTGQLKKLVQEAQALFGATHYGEYHFLWTLSDQLHFEGIEHHQSSDNRSAERSLIDEDLRHSSGVGTLLPHECVHSWNGKYRRPAGLATGNYDTPMRDELLWVYEGLTQYLGLVLGARSGLESPADSRDNWATIAASMQATSGRDWRSLADTAIAAQISYTQAPEWRFRTRSTDFYDESALLWLEADVLIRTESHGAKSLDDFCKLFHGAPSTAPKVVPYDFNEVVKALNAVLPYDWNRFWTERLNRLGTQAPLDGLTASGWRLRFDAQQGDEQKGSDAMGKRSSYTYSLGFSIADEGAALTGLVSGSPAVQAGAAPGSRIIAVNSRAYSKGILIDALQAADDQPRTIRLLVQKDDVFKSLDLHYAGHARYPHLERDDARPDLLTAISTSLTP